MDDVQARKLAPRPARVLVMADAQGLLFAAAQGLPKNGWPVSTVFEEGHVLANVLAHANEHILLLVRGQMTSSFCLPRLIERLRQLDYQGCITYCVRDLTPEMAALYVALPVDRCVQPPTEVQTSLVQVATWLQGSIAPTGPGLSIFEV